MTVIEPRLLIVEDEDDVRDFLVRAFSRVAPHVAVEEARDGAQALTMMQQQSYTLVLSDNRMPVMSGVQLTSAARGLGIATPIVIISADVAIEHVVLAVGATFFYRKPITLEVIRQMAQRWL